MTKDVLVRYQSEDGEIKTEAFDIVALSTGSEPAAKAADLAGRLGIELNEWGFCKTEKFNPLQTTMPGIFVCGTFAGPKEISETLAEAAGAAAGALQFLSPVAGSLSPAPEYPPERSVSGEKPKVGVFVCSCGEEISKVVDLDQVVSHAQRLPDVAYVEKVAYACDPDTRKQIAGKMNELGLNRLVMAACSPRTHESMFQELLRQAGLNSNLVDIANLRDQCAWVHVDEPEMATLKGKDLTAMAVARARLLEPIETYVVEPKKSVLVIGGGATGMSSALAIAQEGFGVTLIEREAELGGNLRRLYSTAEGADPQQFLKELIREVESNDRITVMLNTELVKSTGSAGDFRSTVATMVAGNGGSTETEIEHGATVVATGAVESRPGKYGLGQDDKVITQQDLEAVIAQHSERIKSANSIVMIQCVQPEDQAEAYCSRVCCTAAVKNAIRIKELSPRTDVYVLYKDMMTYGFREQYYTEARRRGVVFVRYSDDRQPDVRLEAGKLRVVVEDPILGERMALQSDLLVLSTSIRPAETNTGLASVLSLPLSREGFFLEAHLKMRPTDFVAPGIFLAGMAHYPKFVDECLSQAAGVAAGVAGLLSKDQAKFRGEVATVDATKCAACLTCVRVCPFDVPFINAEGVAEVDPKKCQGCGTCSGECPAKAIRLFNYYDAQVLAKTKALAGQFVKIGEVAAIGE
ncbi:MAG: FAD-dependent oxidoreductase [Chloroflexi bacterium]|nr:FAD-dependent oxidoreductase [Chloroflexota bacterium]